MRSITVTTKLKGNRKKQIEEITDPRIFLLSDLRFSKWLSTKYDKEVVWFHRSRY